MFEIPNGQICTNKIKLAVEEVLCTHKATGIWTGGEGTIAMVHGVFTYWCDCCMLKEQLAHAKKAASTILELEAKLEKACK